MSRAAATAVPRAALLADTALQIVAQHGLRGLTHRAVDTAAGLPQGSTSYYHRSRAALVRAAVDRLVELDLAELDAPGPVGDPADELAGLGAELLSRWTGPEAWRHLARYELLLEGRRDPATNDVVRAAGERLRAAVTDRLAVAGVRDAPARARWFVAAVDGLLLDALVGPGAEHPRTPEEWRAVAATLAHAVVRGSDRD